jgi:signal transduction histidine kinase
VANISHELRTPLAILRAHLETLPIHDSVPAGASPVMEGGDVVVPEVTVQALQQETARLEALVDDLFALSRAQAGQIEMHVRPVDVAAVVDDVSQVMRPLAASEGMIALSVDTKPGLPHALADAERLRQIIANLVRNAVRHTPEGGIIALSVAAGAEWVVISVADTGEGIPAEHLPHIFDRFYRVDESRSRGSGGAGLGLAIVKEFVELMGGRVAVDSKPGEGTIFSVFLPISR